MPQDRDGTFSTELFERYQRSERALIACLPACCGQAANGY
ncbi:MAG: transposase [Candidatus Marinimicrobia bacterium]|nr:transposase [Candidatus Neomarinimicrobiota bacterium]